MLLPLLLSSLLLAKFFSFYTSNSKKGTEKSPYDVELEIPQSDEKVGEWKGSCNCDSSKNKKKVCSHQLAVLMEWEDDERLTHGLITQSDKVEKKTILSQCK